MEKTLMPRNYWGEIKDPVISTILLYLRYIPNRVYGFLGPQLEGHNWLSVNCRPLTSPLVGWLRGI